MTTRTITVEALAAALHAVDPARTPTGAHTPMCEERAAAIFAALPAEPAGWPNGPEDIVEEDWEEVEGPVPAEPADAGLREALFRLCEVIGEHYAGHGYSFPAWIDKPHAEAMAALAASREEGSDG